MKWISKEKVAPPNVIWECLESRCTAQNGQGLNQQKVRRKKTNQKLQKFCKILRAEKLDVSQQTKNKCRRKTRFLETNQKNLAKENESGRPFILYVVLFSVSRRKLRSFQFSYFPAQNVFISLEYIIEISYWTRKTILTEKYETWFPTEDHAYIIMISQLMKPNEITRKSKHRCASPTWLSCLSWLSW